VRGHDDADGSRGPGRRLGGLVPGRVAPCRGDAAGASVSTRAEHQHPKVALGEGLKFSAVLVNEAPSGGTRRAAGYPVCPTINEIQPEEVVTLELGKSVDLGQWLGQPALEDAGSHAVFVEIENIPDLKWRRPLRARDARTMDLVRERQPFKMSMNPGVFHQDPAMSRLRVRRRSCDRAGRRRRRASMRGAWSRRPREGRRGAPAKKTAVRRCLQIRSLSQL
jgi:hypothetical protein